MRRSTAWKWIPPTGLRHGSDHANASDAADVAADPALGVIALVRPDVGVRSAIVLVHTDPVGGRDGVGGAGDLSAMHPQHRRRRSMN